MSYRYEYKYPLIVLGLPLPGKINPYIVLVSKKKLITVNLEIDTSERTRIRILGEPRPDWRLEIAIRSFVDAVSSRLEQGLDMTIEYEARETSSLYTAGLYAILSHAIVKAIVEAGGYEMTDEEILEACKSIDSEAGTDYDYVYALREAASKGRSLVYREGEESIELGNVNVRIELVGEEEVAEPLQEALEDPIASIIARLAGMIVVRSTQMLRNGVEASDVLRRFARLENALYYAVYGIQPPWENCKWAPSLKAGYGICLESGRGDLIDFT
ncbi:MAG: hypothetical protein ABWW69_02815 [Pyrodictiaceae archaeon]